MRGAIREWTAIYAHWNRKKEPRSRPIATVVWAFVLTISVKTTRIAWGECATDALTRIRWVRCRKPKRNPAEMVLEEDRHGR